MGCNALHINHIILCDDLAAGSEHPAAAGAKRYQTARIRALPQRPQVFDLGVEIGIVKGVGFQLFTPACDEIITLALANALESRVQKCLP